MERMIRAIHFADRAHAGRERKGKKKNTYITHPLAVAIILAGIDAEEDVVVAGILHDTVEDSGGAITLGAVKEQFGARVAEMVENVTEKDKSLSWGERKRIALEHIPHMDKDSLLLKSADQYHNMSDLLDDVKNHGDAAYAGFNAPKAAKLEELMRLVAALSKAWPGNPLLPGLQDVLKELQSR